MTETKSSDNRLIANNSNLHHNPEAVKALREQLLQNGLSIEAADRKIAEQLQRSANQFKSAMRELAFLKLQNPHSSRMEVWQLLVKFGVDTADAERMIVDVEERIKQEQDSNSKKLKIWGVISCAIGFSILGLAYATGHFFRRGPFFAIALIIYGFYMVYKGTDSADR